MRRAVPVGPAALARLPAWTRPAAAGLAAAGACACLAIVDPGRPGSYGVCPFLALTGRWCPGCGTLRAIAALLRLDVPAAVGLNVLTVATLPLLAVAWVRWFAATLGRGRALAVPGSLALGYAGLVVVFWAARNVPALHVLAP